MEKKGGGVSGGCVSRGVVGENQGKGTGEVDRNGQETHSCSSKLELVGIIPPFDPSPHWPSSRVASFSQAWPLVRLVPLGSSFGYHSWRVSAPALRVIGPNTSLAIFLIYLKI